jgi:hypothetical protein
MDKMLSNTCIIRNVESDLKNINEEYEKVIKPFLTEHKDKFDQNKCIDFEYLKEIIGFIMSYSFRDPNEDVIN